ncbi:MAG: DUF4178 domain-containing protein [Myxococcales bacterium]
MAPVRKADCPNCGGPIEFKLGSSAACVCPYCRFSVVRGAGDLEAIGKIADLVPTAPIMVVGDSGEIQGRRFRVGGRLQLDHGKGPWDEWYVELQDGRWGWLAKAQGRFYLTHPIEGASVPAWDEVSPGAQVALPAAGDARWTVTERGGSALVSAEGELPFPAVPMSSGRYADLEGPDGLFATIDYGDGSEPPQLYVGRQIPGDQITVRETALGPRPEEKVAAERLRCPNCGAPVDIHVPETTERAACGSCQSLLDYESGALHYVRTLQQRRLEPLIPLGSEGVLKGEKLIVIGHMERGVQSEGVLYTWNEYLLHGERGYRFLTEDGGHFVLMRPASAGDVREGMGSATYRGKKFRAFTSGETRVRSVVGEFYWQVEVGDRAHTADFVAPPRILSVERSDQEVIWSEGEYVSGAEVWRGLKLPGSPPPARGVSPCQPNPISLRWSATVAAVLLLALFALATTLEWSGGGETVSQPLKMLRVTDKGKTPADTVVYSKPFEVAHGPTTLGLELRTNASNAWVAVAAALINQDTNEVREFFVQAEEWHGRTGGESWSEGSPNETEYLGGLQAGRYVLRYATQWGREGGVMRGSPPEATMHATIGERSSMCCVGSGVLLLLPFMLALVRKVTFEAKRWSQSDMVQVQ